MESALNRGNKKAGPTRFFIARRLFIHVVLGLAGISIALTMRDPAFNG